MKINRLTHCTLILPLLALLCSCGLRTSVQDSVQDAPVPPSPQVETAATLLDMLQTYRALPENRQAVFLQAVADEYQRQGSADNMGSAENALLLALLLSVPEHPGSDLNRAQRLLEHLLSVPWTLRADALNLAHLRYQQVQHLLACERQRALHQADAEKMAALQKQVKTLQETIIALTKIEKTVDTPSPINERHPEQQ